MNPARTLEALTYGTERAIICSHLRPSRRHRSTRSRLQLAWKHLLFWLSRHGNSECVAHDQSASGQVKRRLSRPLGNYSLPHVGLPQLRWSGDRAILPGCFRSSRTLLYDTAESNVVSERGATATDRVLVQYLCWRLRCHSLVCYRRYRWELGYMEGILDFQSMPLL